MKALRRISVLALIAALLANTVIAFGVQRSTPQTARGPVHGDGGVSALYVWDGGVLGAPGTLLRQEPMPAHLTLANAAKGRRVLYSSTDGIDGETR